MEALGNKYLGVQPTTSYISSLEGSPLKWFKAPISKLTSNYMYTFEVGLLSLWCYHIYQNIHFRKIMFSGYGALLGKGGYKFPTFVFLYVDKHLVINLSMSCNPNNKNKNKWSIEEIWLWSFGYTIDYVYFSVANKTEVWIQFIYSYIYIYDYIYCLFSTCALTSDWIKNTWHLTNRVDSHITYLCLYFITWCAVHCFSSVHCTQCIVQI